MVGVQEEEKRGVLVEVKNVIDMVDIDMDIEEDGCDMPDIEEEVVDMGMSMGMVDVAMVVEVVMSGISILTLELW